MALSRVEQKVFIIKKESVRLTSETDPTTGARSIPVLPASEITPNPNLILNEKVFGDAEERDAQAGPEEITGTFELEPGSDKLGEFLLSLFGQVTTDQPDAGGAPNTFRHRFTSAADAQHPTYTMFVDRGAHIKKYRGTSVPQMTFNVPPDNRIGVSIDLAALEEEDHGVSLIPDFSSDLEDLIFSDVSVDIVGVKSSQVRQASVQINHNVIMKRVLCDTRLPVDVVAGRLNVTGGFQLYFENDTERAKFVAGTVSDLNILAQGQTLEAALKATLQLDMPRIKYDAGPISEVDGILVQDFTYRAFRDAALGASIQATLISDVVSL